MVEERAIGERRLQLDGRWGLEEFSGFGRQYEQTYAFVYALDISNDEDEVRDGRVERAFAAYPWRGGWSTVDFYASLRVRVPKRHRPRIVRIEYASPGFIDLALVVAYAITLQKLVKALCDGLNQINSTYNNIYSGMRERKLIDIRAKREQLELTKAEIEFATTSADQLAKLIGFEQMAKVRELTPNAVVALKVLLSFYRRVRVLAKLEKKGQIRF